VIGGRLPLRGRGLAARGDARVRDVRELAERQVPGRGRRRRVAILAMIAVAAIAGFTKAEVERIWLAFAPPVCLAAATALQERHLRPVLALLAGQALASELLWNTVW
jgi:hypothetical protein